MSIDDFLTSTMYFGSPAYPYLKEKPWHGFLYLARGEEDNVFKVGYTNYDLGRRALELNRDNIDTPFYLWESPNPQVLEKYVKRQLVQFTNPGGKYSSEIFYNIPRDVLIETIRYIILYIVLKERWYNDEKRFRVLEKWFGGVRFNVIKKLDIQYKAQDVEIDENNYEAGTRVMVNYDGKDWEGKIVKKLKRYKDKTTEKVVVAYEVEFLDGSKGNYQNKFIDPMYSEIDVDRVFDLDKVQLELSATAVGVMTEVPLFKL